MTGAVFWVICEKPYGINDFRGLRFLLFRRQTLYPLSYERAPHTKSVDFIGFLAYSLKSYA